ncbi:hypothetical protein [Rhodococcus phage REQ1]|nr:hypothetical protein RoPhREQ1_gp40 [Rhodococcus phage REQ1]AEV52036.1 hypothetical protein [Rhodococcus phage REQ1]
MELLTRAVDADGSEYDERDAEDQDDRFCCAHCHHRSSRT